MTKISRVFSGFKCPLRASGGLKQVFEMLVKMGKDTPRCGGGRRADGKMWRSEKPNLRASSLKIYFLRCSRGLLRQYVGVNSPKHAIIPLNLAVVRKQ
jgi:hypothetical protein